MDRLLQYSGVLVILGLLVEVLCLLWTRPMAFVVFLGVGGLFLGLGVLVYLFALVSSRHPGR
jgi:uncharacterized membrane protein